MGVIAKAHTGGFEEGSLPDVVLPNDYVESRTELDPAGMEETLVVVNLDGLNSQVVALQVRRGGRPNTVHPHIASCRWLLLLERGPALGAKTPRL